MRKRLTRCALAAALIGVVMLVVVSQYHSPGIWMGNPSASHDILFEI